MRLSYTQRVLIISSLLATRAGVAAAAAPVDFFFCFLSLFFGICVHCTTATYNVIVVACDRVRFIILFHTINREIFCSWFLKILELAWCGCYAHFVRLPYRSGCNSLDLYGTATAQVFFALHISLSFSHSLAPHIIRVTKY